MVYSRCIKDEEARWIKYNQKFFFDIGITEWWLSVGDQVNLFNFISRIAHGLITDTCIEAGMISDLDRAGCYCCGNVSPRAFLFNAQLVLFHLILCCFRHLVRDISSMWHCEKAMRATRRKNGVILFKRWRELDLSCGTNQQKLVWAEQMHNGISPGANAVKVLARHGRLSRKLI